MEGENKYKNGVTSGVVQMPVPSHLPSLVVLGYLKCKGLSTSVTAQQEAPFLPSLDIRNLTSTSSNSSMI